MTNTKQNLSMNDIAIRENAKLNAERAQTVTAITGDHVRAAQRLIDEAGQAGGIDEVRRIAEKGWPASGPLKNDSQELRVAIQREAKWIVAGVDGDE